MSHEKYSIHVRDYNVIIYGQLTMEETLHLLNHFEKLGFKCLCPGDENSTLNLFKEDENN